MSENQYNEKFNQKSISEYLSRISNNENEENTITERRVCMDRLRLRAECQRISGRVSGPKLTFFAPRANMYFGGPPPPPFSSPKRKFTKIYFKFLISDL